MAEKDGAPQIYHPPLTSSGRFQEKGAPKGKYVAKKEGKSKGEKMSTFNRPERPCLFFECHWPGLPRLCKKKCR